MSVLTARQPKVSLSPPTPQSQSSIGAKTEPAFENGGSKSWTVENNACPPERGSSSGAEPHREVQSSGCSSHGTGRGGGGGEGRRGEGRAGYRMDYSNLDPSRHGSPRQVLLTEPDNPGCTALPDVGLRRH
ncbi:unnamed protein product [Pleuronectes platessa]|uniref:Uncharacterized protein n=1 Tax=Pleuronectes platessa TaxID=8262 RepID=A0A9N7VLL9_PLEPL|nr:unnamed protein product [Pleuronectes platessa]